MIDVLGPESFDRSDNFGNTFQQFSVGVGIFATSQPPIVEMPQLDAQYGGLNFVQAAIPSLFGGVIFFWAAVIAQDAHDSNSFRNW